MIEVQVSDKYYMFVLILLPQQGDVFWLAGNYSSNLFLKLILIRSLYFLIIVRHFSL